MESSKNGNGRVGNFYLNDIKNLVQTIISIVILVGFVGAYFYWKSDVDRTVGAIRDLTAVIDTLEQRVRANEREIDRRENRLGNNEKQIDKILKRLNSVK